MIFNCNDDDLKKIGFIDKNEIFNYVTERQIFELVFGFQPKEFDYVTSPFRKDNNAGCWFEYNNLSNKLNFIDFGSQIYNKDKKVISLDCFEAVKIYYNLPNFYKTLEFIKNKLILGKKLKIIQFKKTIKKNHKKKVEINIETRPFDSRDKVFWMQYGISKQQLINDNVFPVKKIFIKHSRKGDFSKRVYDICYAYTQFENNKKKLYRPYQKGKYRFLSTCSKNDIGGIKSLCNHNDKLIITKSYKDYRVLKNQNLHAVWFQNEGMVPDENILFDLCKRFNHISVFYDNDSTGIKESERLSKIINSYFSYKSKPIYLPISLLYKNVKDPSDFYVKYGKELLIQFLNENKLL